MITGAQIRAARALLNWSTLVLSARSKVPRFVIQAAEAIDGVPDMEIERLQAVLAAFNKGGVELIGTVGVKYVGSGPPRPVGARGADAEGREIGAAMANEGLINLLGWCKRERESLQMQREMLQSGKFRIIKDEAQGRSTRPRKSSRESQPILPSLI
jgi:hypothetical protein